MPAINVNESSMSTLVLLLAYAAPWLFLILFTGLLLVFKRGGR